MDIELLSKMVKELILDNDRVSLPGVGAFVAEMMPSSFSDRGYTVNPPYRRLGFRQGRDQEKDSLLVDLYASANKVDRSIAELVIKEFAEGLVAELKQRKAVVFPGLGRLRATKENLFFFVPDENLDIFPEGFGMGPVSLKSHSKPTSLDFSEVDAAASEPSAATETAPEPTEQQQPTATETYPATETATETYPEKASEKKSLWKRPWFVILFTIICIAAVAALLYAAVLLLAKYCPDFLDRLLYSKEELEIIYNYKK